MFEELKRFHKKYRHIRVTERKDAKLHRWLLAQEERVSLSKDRQRKLESLGMVWKNERKNERQKKWDAMFTELRKFYLEHGHLIVPVKNRKLRLWLHTLKYWNKTLTDAQLKKLKSVKYDFSWKRSDFVNHRWENRYLELKDFFKKFGHSNPSNKGSHDSLGRWVQSQKKKRKKLTKEQIKKLEQLKFDWRENAIFDQRWDKHFEELKKFKKKFGHCVPPVTQYSVLRSWVYIQRKIKMKLSVERKKKLDSLGFTWR